jgi:hypothetical protein
LNERNGGFAVFDYGTQELSEDEAIISTIKTQVEQDKEVVHAREKVAEILSDKDPVLAGILRMHLEFNNGAIDKYPIKLDGITFYKVGRNASHEFSLGVKDGKLYKHSIGEGEWNEEENFYTVDEHIREVKEGEGFGYIGHF